MSPHLIIIILLSCCSLIIVMISALHRQERKLLAAIEPASATHILSGAHIQEILQLISRFQFFAGTNRARFEYALRSQDLPTALTLMQQKFAAQGKPKPRQLAIETLEKLIRSTDPLASPPDQHTQQG